MNYIDVASKIYVYSNLISLFILVIIIILYGLKIIKKQFLAISILILIILSMLFTLLNIKI